ncbi:MAG: hypothetical protein J6J35_06615 [Alphaproteobacteria bacterium]|nr:hypothetical protein [Alphaproteobacteria bacterium]
MKLHCYKDEDKEFLENQIIPHEARVAITRCLMKIANQSNDGTVNCASKINLYSILATTLCNSMVNFMPDDWGMWTYQEETYLNNKIPSLIQNASSLDLYETLSNIIEHNWLPIEKANSLFQNVGIPVHYKHEDGEVVIERLQSLENDIPTKTEKHPSMQQLLDRAENCLNRDDGAGVLHATASIFEALAKNVFATPTVQNQTLKSFFEGYRNRSHLPEEMLNYIISVYDCRNNTPNAGHGCLEFSSEISKDEMVAMIELAKAAIHIEDKCR